MPFSRNFSKLTFCCCNRQNNKNMYFQAETRIEIVFRNRSGSRSIGSERWFRCKSDIYSVATASTWTFRHRGGPTKIYSRFGRLANKGVFVSRNCTYIYSYWSLKSSETVIPSDKVSGNRVPVEIVSLTKNVRE